MIQGGGTPPFGAILPWLLTTLPKLKDVVSFLALDSTVQIDKFKSFFAKLEEENVLAKTEKLFMTKKLDKLEKELENRATLRSELDLAKKDLVIAKLSLADKDNRLFEQ